MPGRSRRGARDHISTWTTIALSSSDIYSAQGFGGSLGLGQRCEVVAAFAELRVGARAG